MFFYIDLFSLLLVCAYSTCVVDHYNEPLIIVHYIN